MEQKRFENRDLCADLVKVTWPLGMDQPYIDWAILGDISPSGACLEIEDPIPVNTAVELEFGDDQCHAVVRYCKYDKVNYLLGVEFESGYRWSSRRWEPKHLVEVYPHESSYN
ncbi:MAG: PilZ domain-containing protein [Acidobacteriota bacterium]|nr:PilZ domain-containing protein [Acidobacteriota bacterium]